MSGRMGARFWESVLAVVLLAGAVASEAQKPDALRLGVAGGVQPDVVSHYYWYAQSQGYYRKQGLDLTILPLQDDQVSIRALLAGEVDVAGCGCSAVLRAMEVGAALKIVGVIENRLDYTLIAKSDVKSPKDLAGRSLAVSAPGAISYQVPKLMIEAAGGDFRAVRVVSLGGTSSRAQALLVGSVDASVLTSLWVERLKSAETLHPIADATQIDLLSSCAATSDPVLREKRAAIERFLAAAIKGAQWGMGNPDKAAAESGKLLPDLKDGPRLLGATLKSFAAKKYWNTDAVISKASWDFTVKTLVESGDLKTPPSFEKYFAQEVAQAASARARETP